MIVCYKVFFCVGVFPRSCLQHLLTGFIRLNLHVSAQRKQFYENGVTRSSPFLSRVCFKVKCHFERKTKYHVLSGH